MTKEELQAIDERLSKADNIVQDLCHGKQRWTMNVPVSPDDPDIVITNSLRDVKTLAAEVRRLQAENAELRAELERLRASGVTVEDKPPYPVTLSIKDLPAHTPRVSVGREFEE